MFYTLILKDNVVLVTMTDRVTSEAIMTLLSLGYTIYQSALKADENGLTFHKERDYQIHVDLFVTDAQSIHSQMQSYVQ
jgi:hypothetical protein